MRSKTAAIGGAVGSADGLATDEGLADVPAAPLAVPELDALGAGAAAPPHEAATSATRSSTLAIRLREVNAESRSMRTPGAH
jgi:hypothetical protein